MKILNLFPILILLLVLACTPKPITSSENDGQNKEDMAKEDATNDSTPKEIELSPCKNWLELPEDEQKRIMISHSLYRDVMKNIGQASEMANLSQDNFDQAIENWQLVFNVAPAADGRRNTHYGDGIKIYEYLASQEKDSLIRDGHIKKVLELYDEVIRCYGSEGTTTARKAFDIYYKFPEYATEMEKYNMFKKAFDLEKEDTPAYVFNPFTNLLANLVNDNKISSQEGGEYAEMMQRILEKNKSEMSPAKWTAEGWDVVQLYMPERLKNLEGVKGFYNCEYYKSQYYSIFESAPTDCDSILKVLSRLKWGDCAGSDPQVDIVFTAYKDNCLEESESNCRGFLTDGDFAGAVVCYDERAQTTDDNSAKANYYLTIAKIYYGELKQFSKARSAAYDALKYRPNWGAPYMLIGKLYASSGPLCGSGRGWESQVVTWPAIDKWQKAKQVDPSVSSEANNLIARYQQYMPSVEDVFQRGLKEGQTFRVSCWIQETTTIRAARN